MGLEMAVTGTLVASNLTSSEEHLAIHNDAIKVMEALKLAVEQTYTDIDSAWLVICGTDPSRMRVAIRARPRLHATPLRLSTSAAGCGGIKARPTCKS